MLCCDRFLLSFDVSTWYNIRNGLYNCGCPFTVFLECEYGPTLEVCLVFLMACLLSHGNLSFFVADTVYTTEQFLCTHCNYGGLVIHGALCEAHASLYCEVTPVMFNHGIWFVFWNLSAPCSQLEHCKNNTRVVTSEIVLLVAKRSPIDTLTCLHAAVCFFLFNVSVLVLLIDFCFWTLEVLGIVFLGQCDLELYYLFENNLLISFSLLTLLGFFLLHLHYIKLKHAENCNALWWNQYVRICRLLLC
jgi:hypothetical protein